MDIQNLTEAHYKNNLGFRSSEYCQVALTVKVTSMAWNLAMDPTKLINPSECEKCENVLEDLVKRQQ